MKTESVDKLNIFFVNNIEKLMNTDPKKTIFFFCLMVALNSKPPQKGHIIDVVSEEHNSVLMRSLQERECSWGLVILPIVVYFHIQKAHFNLDYLEKIMVKNLQKEQINAIEANLNYDYYYSFFYDIYYQYKEFLSKSALFRQFLKDNQNDKEILQVLFNEFNNFPEKNYEIYMKKNWFFSIIATNLSKQDTEIYKKSMQLVIDKAQAIEAKDPEQFLKLVFLLKISDQLAVSSKLKTNDIISLKIYQNID